MRSGEPCGFRGNARVCHSVNARVVSSRGFGNAAGFPESATFWVNASRVLPPLTIASVKNPSIFILLLKEKEKTRKKKEKKKKKKTRKKTEKKGHTEKRKETKTKKKTNFFLKK